MSSKVTEIAAVSIKKEAIEGLEGIRGKVKTWMETQDGFISWSQHQSVEEPGLIIDILEWDSIENAQAASEAMMNSPAGQEYSAIMEEVKLFTHVKQISH
jgi:hypothetical protein